MVHKLEPVRRIGITGIIIGSPVQLFPYTVAVEIIHFNIASMVSFTYVQAY